jgi:hypothetical protein
MEFTESALFEDLPCRVSFKRVASADDSDNAAPLEQAVTLFLSVDVDIPPGSRVVVGRGGRSLEYHSSGEPAVYSSHQEIALESRGDWA